MRVLLILTLLVLAFGAKSDSSPLPNSPHIYVEGYAEIEVAPDIVEFSISLEHTHLSLAKAKADVDGRSVQLIDLLKKLDISDKNIATTTLSIRPSLKYVDGQRVPDGTHVSRRVDITLTDISKYSGVMSALVDSNISEVISTRLKVSNDKDVMDKAMMAALQDAKQRAERIALSEHKRLGDPYSISEFQTRGQERYQLQVNRKVSGQSAATDVFSESLGRVAGIRQEVFEPGVMVASAQVYVVYLLDR